jgi:hypothetical protein
MLDDMEEPKTTVTVFPFQRGDLLTKLNRLANLEKLKKAHTSICQMIEEKEEGVRIRHCPRNPREDVIQAHDDKTLVVWKRLQVRQKEQIMQLEEQIRQDIETSKAE